MSKITKEVSELVRKACKSQKNYFGGRTWEEHILPVVKFAKILAKKMKADEEMVELAALLHDYASLKNKKFVKDHHIHGSRLAREILEKYNYPGDKIKNVVHCIYTHRGSKKIPRKTIEAKIIASADAMSHIDQVGSMLFLAYSVHGMNTEDGTKWVLDKLERSWNKLIPEAKEIIEEKYKAIQIALR